MAGMAWNRRKLQANFGSFMRQYGRRAHAGHDPNDRGYDRKVEKLVKQMSPEELDELINGERD
ncbi:MAG: hypothetical protein AB7V43_14835 [Acidimicrobiia bacterium]